MGRQAVRPRHGLVRAVCECRPGDIRHPGGPVTGGVFSHASGTTAIAEGPREAIMAFIVALCGCYGVLSLEHIEKREFQGWHHVRG